jgi:uncharacterized protein YegP (UPF0339 family)
MTVETVRVYQDEAGEWRWTAKAANGQTVADSGEGYKHRGHAERMAAEMFPGAKLIVRGARSL